MANDKKIGKHTIKFEEPDTFMIILEGDLNAKEVIDLYAVLAEFREKNGRSASLLVDAKRMSSMTSEARKATVTEIKKDKKFHENYYTAVFGASFQIRVLINLLLNAVSIVTGQPNNAKFFKTEEEARAWLQECRAKSS